MLTAKVEISAIDKTEGSEHVSATGRVQEDETKENR